MIEIQIENGQFLTSHDRANEFRDPENIEQDILHDKIRTFIRSISSPQ